LIIYFSYILKWQDPNGYLKNFNVDVRVYSFVFTLIIVNVITFTYLEIIKAAGMVLRQQFRSGLFVGSKLRNDFNYEFKVFNIIGKVE
jgi:hypothetical protein